MADTLTFQSREARINSDIRTEVARIGAARPIVLPEPGAELVQSYVRKIEGTYNVDRAKNDTDNAIDLLYIAYNTTPQKQGEIRVTISKLMGKLITTQQKSEISMRLAMKTAEKIVKSLEELFPDWLDVKDKNSQEKFKEFSTSDLVDLARNIKVRALKVRDDLLLIATTYDDIIKDTVTATSSSEKVLSQNPAEKEAIEKEINEANAKREQLEALVGDLAEEVAKFDKMARDYEARASTAEQRAFVMSIVRVGAQMISQAVPAIAMAAGGPAPMLATSALSVLNGPAPSRPSADAPDAAKTTEAVQTKTKISEQKAEIKKAEEKANTLKAEIRNLEAEKAKVTAKDGQGSAPSQKEASAAQATEVAEFDRRIKAKADELAAQEQARARLETVVDSLQASLGAVDKGLGKLTDEQQQQASSLRDMQMRMLDKVETYEKERRTQSAELVKINALLKGSRKNEDNIQLAVRSLNLSLTALKRTKEIVEEIAFFFKSFADFMDGIASDASDQVESIDDVADLETISRNKLGYLVKSVDEFFIKQTAEWHAVWIVSEKFNRSFAEGWSKLNKLSGTFITGDQLIAYMDIASVKLTAIVAEREAASEQKIASLDAFRAQIRDSA